MLSIRNYSVTIEGREILKNIALDINDGEIVGVVGESGSGKSMTALGIMGLLPDKADVTGGSIIFNGEDLTKKSPKDMCSLRGDDIAMVFQEPMTSLNPTMKIGKQLIEVMKVHSDSRHYMSNGGGSSEKSKDVALEMLKRAGLEDSGRVFDSYPHELSGGMRQRAMIAMAIMLHPWLLIADEPTTALDVTVQRQILELLSDLNRNAADHPMSILFITHDLDLAERLCSRLVVMKDGAVVETGSMEKIMECPENEYTKKLIAASMKKKSGKCRSASGEAGRKTGDGVEDKLVLRVNNLSAFYKGKRKSLFKAPDKFTAVDNVSFEVRRGEILGLVGESGCGKTSLSKAILGVNRDISGTIEMNCRLPRMIFQDPYSSLNPAYTVEWLLEEPLAVSGVTSKKERRERAREILELMGLDNDCMDRYPSQLSGGQRQRVSIGQALITNPQLVIADEPVSALDVTIQEQIIGLMLRAQERMKLGIIFITHDMNVIYQMCDRVMVMKDGRIIEAGSTASVFASPREQYTRKLLEAAKKI